MRKPGQISLDGSIIFLVSLMMMGSFLSGNQIQITDSVVNLISLQNVGIAVVTPTEKLEIVTLFCEAKIANESGRTVFGEIIGSNCIF